ncbi:MAG: Ig-like domain repeat protein [Burkholderiales bacterium]|nr:Ig-like domain repeat protein [Burkholderiales bacterium]
MAKGRAAIRSLVVLLALAASPGAVAQRYMISGGITRAGTELVMGPGETAYVGGALDSYDYPGIDSGVVANAGYNLRYVAKLDLATQHQLWVAVVGAPSKLEWTRPPVRFAEDEARGMAVAADGSVYLVAYDGSRNFPQVGGAYVRATVKHVFRVSAAGQVTRLSPPLDPAIRSVGAIALDAAGNIYLTGSATGGLATTPGAAYPTSSVAGSCVAPFVVKFDPTAQTTLYATYLGYAGTQGEACGSSIPFVQTGFAIAVDAAGNAVVGGQASPGVRATPGAIDLGSKTPVRYYRTWSMHASHGFVTKLSPTGGIVFSARLGGAMRDRVTSVLVDPASGAIHVGGKTASRDFPMVPPAMYPINLLTCAGQSMEGEMGFVTKLNADATQIQGSVVLPMYGTQLAECGANPYGQFAPVALARDAAGQIFATGETSMYERYFEQHVDAISTEYPVSLRYVFDPALTVRYYTPYARYHPTAIAVDGWGHAWVANGALTRFSVGRTPVSFTNPLPLCAPSGTLSAYVAGANSTGTVEFFVDGASMGTAPVVESRASKAVPLRAGARSVKATYRGATYFDGYSSEDRFMPVNQAGACQ